MIRSILVGTDTSAAATMAVEEASELARSHGAELVVLYVRPPVDAREVFDPLAVPDVDGHFNGLATRLTGCNYRTRRESGDAAATICDVAVEEGVDVIVVGNRGTHARRKWLLGSVPNAVLQRSPCSVYVVDTREAQ